MQQNNTEQKKSLSWSDPNAAGKQTPGVEWGSMPATMSMVKRVAAAVAATVVLVALVVWSVSALRAGRQDGIANTAATSNAYGADTTAAGSDATDTVSGSSLLTIVPQSAGMSVSVAGLSVTTPTWVVVYEDVAGKPGNTLGAALVFPGQNAVTVSLLRATVSGQTYLVGEASTEAGSHVYSRSTEKLGGWATFTAQ